MEQYEKKFQQFLTEDKSPSKILIKESSTLKGIGATPSQISAVHTHVFLSKALRHDANWELVKNKTELKKAISDNEQTAVVTFDSSGNIYYIDNGIVTTYTPEGDKINTLSGNLRDIIKSIPRGTYYIAKKGKLNRPKRSHETSKYLKDEEQKDNIIKNIVSNLTKFLGEDYTTLEQEIKIKIKNAFDDNDYEKVEKLLNTITTNQGPKSRIEKKPLSHIFGVSESALEEYFKEKITQRIFDFEKEDNVDASLNEIKQIAYKVAVEAIKELRNKLRKI